MVLPSRITQTRLLASGPKTTRQYLGFPLYSGSFPMVRSILLRSAAGNGRTVKMITESSNKRDRIVAPRHECGARPFEIRLPGFSLCQPKLGLSPVEFRSRD